MAPTTVVNSTGPLPTGQGFGGDEFSNNLFSDLAPLLTLLGEQVTKQFLSMSMGWADDILLAMGPLGIMTIIVSAIRVGGIKILKALVGRARESSANAEKEILSSTSDDVCELWSGREIVRELGTPGGMKDLVLLAKSRPFKADNHLGHSMLTPGASGSMPERIRVFDINTAVNYGILKKPPGLASIHVPDISNGAPNITLNVRNSTASPKELWAWAVLGTTLQISALVFPAVSTYYLKWGKGDAIIAAYGYPCFAAGTVMVVLGMIFCGRVIEGSTTEHDFTLNSEEVPSDFRGQKYSSIHKQPISAQIMRVQKACIVSDQHFQSYAIFNSRNDGRVRTSRLNTASYSFMAAIATLTAVVGFVMQFVGLRALHWSATIYQLGVMLILTIVRSSVRRGLFEDPDYTPLLDGHELAWLTLYIVGRDRQGWDTEEPKQTSAYHLPADEGVQMRDMQSSDPSPSEQSSVLRGNTPKTSKSWKLGVVKKFPYITLSARDVVKETREPEQLMLKGLFQWEPMTGNYNVEEIRLFIHHIFASLAPSKSNEAALRVLQIEYTRLSQAFYPLSGRMICEKRDGTDGVTETLNIYQDLQRIMPTSDEARDVTMTLASAIEHTMAILAQHSAHHILWRPTQDPFRRDPGPETQKTLKFHTDLLVGAHDRESNGESSTHLEKLALYVTGHGKQRSGRDHDEVDHGPWTIDTGPVCSIICLWLFSLELRRNAARKLAVATRELHAMGQSVAGFASDLAPLSTILYTRRNTYFRIIASEINNACVEYDQLRRWLRSPIERLPVLGKRLPGDLNGRRGTEPISNAWTVWGARYSTLFRPSASSEDLDRPQELAVRTKPDTTLAGHCALELFSSFMEAIADRIEAIGGTTRLVSNGSEGDDMLVNSLLQSIASECVLVGLASDEDEAYSVIIPAFMKNSLLPREPHSEIRYPGSADSTAS